MAGYTRRMPVLWWTRRVAHLRFIARELTSLAVGYSAVLLLLMLRAVLKGPDVFTEFTEWLKAPVVVVWHSLVVIALVFHSITWFNLAPKAMVVKAGGRRIPDFLILAGNYGGWVVISILLLWLISKP